MSSDFHPKALRLAGLAALLALATVLAAWLHRDVLLTAVAHAWIVSDVPAQADALVVLGGDLEVRPFSAARLYGQGFSKRILVSDVRPLRSEKIGAAQPHSELNRQVLLKLGVPAAAIESFGHENRNTYDEAVALRAWASRTHAVSLLIPTEIFSARRVRWVMQRVFDGTGVSVHVTAVDGRDYNAADWWQSERALVIFETELLKYAYYRVVHRS